MNFLSITSSDDMWKKVSQFAQNCSWRAGKSLSQSMSDNTFSDWERVMVALHENDIAGYCTIAKSDCIPNISYTPYIGYLFVNEKYRGQRLSQRLISFAIPYLQTLKFHQVYLVSDHENLYEKYGFKVIDTKTAPWGICLSFMQIHAHFYINYIIYYGLLIFCCQNVATHLL